MVKKYRIAFIDANALTEGLRNSTLPDQLIKKKVSSKKKLLFFCLTTVKDEDSG